MRAWQYDRYGGPEVLRLADVPEPEAGAGELLIRIAAASVNAADWHLMRGDPLMVRAVTGFGARPRRVTTIGSDIAGLVEAVGDGVEGFAVGDRVIAEVDTGGAAGLVAVRATGVAAAPVSLRLAEAAAIPMAGITALRAVRDGAHVGAGDRVVVNGASGGVGTFAVQLAVAMGAEVTAITSARNRELVAGLGASRVVAYDEVDVATSVRDADAVVDIVGLLTIAQLRRMVRPRGRVVLVGGNGGRWLGPAARMLGAVFVNPFVREALHPVMDSGPRGEGLATLAALVDAGAVRPVIEREFAFGDVPAAIAHLETGRTRGKLVIPVAELD